MVDYKNTKIYYIPVGTERYYGHTTQPLYKRKKEHRNDFNRDTTRKIYIHMRELNMWAKDIDLILVENYPCENKEQAHARERFYIEQFGTLNMVMPARTYQEYIIEYRINNREKIRESRRAYSDIANKNRRERAKHSSHHCDVCDVDIKGLKTMFNRHLTSLKHINNVKRASQQDTL